MNCCDCLCFVLYSNGLLVLVGRLVRERWDWLFGTKFLECLSLSGCLRILMIEVLWLPCYIALMLGTLLPCYINNAWYWCQVRCCLGILMPHHPKFVDQQICKGCISWIVVQKLSIYTQSSSCYMMDLHQYEWETASSVIPISPTTGQQVTNAR